MRSPRRRDPYSQLSVTVAALLGLTLWAPASQAIEPYSCRNGSFPAYDGAFSLGEITARAEERIHFRDDGKGCPTHPGCVEKAYLVNGDPVIVAQQEAGWACAWYFGTNREFVGWLPDASIKPLPVPDSPPLEAWSGSWKPIIGGNQIHIRPSDIAGLLDAEGSAIWASGLTHSGEPIEHLGSFAGSAAATGTALSIREGIDDWTCQVDLQLVGIYLVVHDNHQCGGMNVRFNDIYRKAP